MLFLKSFVIVVVSAIIFRSLDASTEYFINSDIRKKSYNEPVESGLRNSSMPAYKLQLVGSKTIFSPSLELVNKYSIFLLFDPYCPHCKKQMEEIIGHIDYFKDITFVFISPFPEYQVRRVVDQFSLNKYRNILVGIDNANNWGVYFNVTGLPYLVIYNSDRKLANSFVGEVGFDQIKDEIKHLQ